MEKNFSCRQMKAANFVYFLAEKNHSGKIVRTIVPGEKKTY